MACNHILERLPLLPPASEGWGKVLFSICQSTPRPGGGGVVPHPSWQGEGTPVLSQARGTPSGWWGIPHPIWLMGHVLPVGTGWGYPNPDLAWGSPLSSTGWDTPPPLPPPPHLQRGEHLLRGGQYASGVVHAGGFSCFHCFQSELYH